MPKPGIELRKSNTLRINWKISSSRTYKGKEGKEGHTLFLDIRHRRPRFKKPRFRRSLHPMTTRSVILPEPLEAFVEAEVASGAYADAVLAAAVDLLQREQRRGAAKVERQALIQEGLDDLEAGRVQIVEDLGAWFDQIEAELDEASRAA